MDISRRLTRSMSRNGMSNGYIPRKTKLKNGFGFTANTAGYCRSTCKLYRGLDNNNQNQNQTRRRSNRNTMFNGLAPSGLNVPYDFMQRNTFQAMTAPPVCSGLGNSVSNCPGFANEFHRTSTRQTGVRLESKGLEFDAIIPNDVHWHFLEPSPKIDESDLRIDFDGMPSIPDGKMKKGSHKDSQIRIFHEYQDSDQGDEFGAVLRTYEPNVKGERIRQHFLVNLERNGPADKMRLKNEDELVLVNDVFAPEQTHEEVINIFHHAKVDGKTRFRLVIRRIVIEPVVITKKKQKKSGSKTWQWVETSAILAPDFRQALDDQPIVKNVESEVLSNNQYQTQCHRRYRTENGLYIDISERGICANKNVSLNGDRTKIIIKTSKYSQDGQGNITWYASLKAIDKTEYICMTKDRATLKTEPDWFVVSDRTSGKIGEDIFFRKNGMYLACSEHSGHIGVSPKVYRFAEKDIHLGFDHPDKGVTMDMASSDFTTCYNPERVVYDPQHCVSDMPMPQHLDPITRYRRNNDMPVTGWSRDINFASTSCSSLECDSPMVTNDYEDNGFSSNNSYIPLKTTATMSMMAMCIDN